MGTENFKKVVAEYIGYEISSHRWKQDKMQELVNKFACKTENTVIRWILEMDNPSEELKKLVVGHIQAHKPLV